jgi:putative transposase
MASVAELVPVIGVAAACEAVGVPRANFYRQAGRSATPVRPSPRHEGAAGERSELSVPSAAADRAHPRALSVAERAAVLDVLHTPRFQDAAPAAVYATLLDEGTYLASERTMYRLLAAEGETRPRRDQLVHPADAKPELLATAPNQVWSWDITKLLGPAKWTYFYLYVILDIFSRYVTGWMVAHREHADLAERLIAETIVKQDVPAGQLTLHADRGSSMISKPVAFLLADLGVTKTHSRPHVSNDNPYSEAQFKTLKVPPRLPGPLRLDRGGQGLLPGLLPLVQRRAPARRHRPAGPRGRPLRPGPGGLRRPLPGARHRVRGPSRALRSPCTAPASAADCRLDQSAHAYQRHAEYT